MDQISPSAVRASQDLRTVFGRLRRRLRELGTLGGAELTPSQLAVFGRLAKAGETSASALAVAEGIRPQSMAAILAALQELGLVERRPDPEDGRRQLVSLSEAGRERAVGDRTVRAEWLAGRLQDRCTEAERRTLIEAAAILERVVAP
jgi:DNA-binding MarR family transcriptional regulator